MSLKTDSVEMMALFLIVAVFLSGAAYLAIAKSREQRSRRSIATVSTALIEYFRKTGVEVSVDCIGNAENSRFTAFIESEPMKRFRLSHIIELTLREHVQKTCGLELEKVYWRFPIKETAQAKEAATETEDAGKGSGPAADDYINEGLVHYRHLPKFEVTEIPWEKFEEVSTKDPQANTRHDETQSKV